MPSGRRRLVAGSAISTHVALTASQSKPGLLRRALRLQVGGDSKLERLGKGAYSAELLELAVERFHGPAELLGLEREPIEGLTL